MAARQNHTDAGVTSARKAIEKAEKVLYTNQDYEQERWDKLDTRLGSIEKKVA